ncbi:MAG: signal peptidase II [bacterium]|nr:signal peptidase II [bacterium]
MKKKIFILSFIILLIDQLSKIILDKVLILGKSIKIFDKFLYITKVYNDGISFSMLTGKRYLIIIISIIILVFLYFYLKKFKENKKNIIAFSLLIGGLLGNLIDRIIHGYVIDFIDFYIFNYNYPIFNIADVCICIGVFILLYSIYLGEDNENSSGRK